MDTGKACSYEEQAAMREGEEKVEKRVNARAEQVIKVVGEALVRRP